MNVEVRPLIYIIFVILQCHHLRPISQTHRGLVFFCVKGIKMTLDGLVDQLKHGSQTVRAGYCHYHQPLLHFLLSPYLGEHAQ